MAAHVEWERVVGTLMVLSFVLGLGIGCAAGVAMVSPRTRTALCGAFGEEVALPGWQPVPVPTPLPVPPAEPSR